MCKKAHHGNQSQRMLAASCYSLFLFHSGNEKRMSGERTPEFFAGKNLKIGIIGCGYVGLPLALRFADVGHRVTGFDVDQFKIDKLNAGESYIQHIPADKILEHVQAKRLHATTDFSVLREMDAVLICVP